MPEQIDLVIDTFGAVIRRRGERFVIFGNDRETEIAADGIRQILLTSAVVVTTAAMELALTRQIDIVLIGKSGSPVGRIVPCAPSGPVRTRRNQVLVCVDGRGTRLASAIITAKIRNMGYLLKALAKTRELDMVDEAGSTLLNIADDARTVPFREMSHEPAISRLRGIEGDAANRYFSALREIVRPPFFLGFRSRRPARDLFNSALNYGYGILYAEVESACLIAGLDPNCGIVHADRSGNASFVYDFIEQFRQPVIDRAVITLFTRHQMVKKDTDETYYLLNSGKQKVIGAVVQRLTERIEYRGRSLTYRQVIQEKARECVRFLNEGETFTPFTHRW